MTQRHRLAHTKPVKEANLKKTHFLREISKSMHIKKVAKKIFFATRLVAFVGLDSIVAIYSIVF